VLPVKVFNLEGEAGWDAEGERDGYRHRRVALGPLLGGGELLGGSLYELPPGEATWPYHYELGCEEWLVVASGRPTLRGPEDERQLDPGDVVAFPEGPAGGHKLENRTDEPCRVLLLSSKSPLAIVHYPESGKVGLWSSGGGYDLVLRTEPKLDYWDDE
jgi:uncharacterized cupin superfamily protein